METKNIILELRNSHGLSQEELAEKVFVTRQAVSRWETGDTVPNTETLKLLSGIFGVSINTILGSPRKLICQCCGMPLEDELISKETDGSFNENYCKWCYADGNYTYHDMDELINVCVKHMAVNGFSEEQARVHMKDMLPKLDYWKNHTELEDGGQTEDFKKLLIDEFNALGIKGMPRVERIPAWRRCISVSEGICSSAVRAPTAPPSTSRASGATPVLPPGAATIPPTSTSR